MRKILCEVLPNFSLPLGDFQELLIIFLLFRQGKRLVLSKKATLFHPLGYTKISTTVSRED